MQAVDYDPNLVLYRTLDFGFVNPFVCLWIQVDNEAKVRLAATFCDPAGAGVNDVTGTSVIRELRSLGITARFRRSSVLEGIELIRRAIRSGDGQSRLVISPRCQRLIEAMQCYHYPEPGSTAAAGELPLKDGLYDHPIDALRYFFVNYTRSSKTTSRRY